MRVGQTKEKEKGGAVNPVKKKDANSSSREREREIGTAYEWQAGLVGWWVGGWGLGSGSGHGPRGLVVAQSLKS